VFGIAFELRLGCVQCLESLGLGLIIPFTGHGLSIGVSTIGKASARRVLENEDICEMIEAVWVVENLGVFECDVVVRM